jgi:ribonuclease Y
MKFIYFTTLIFIAGFGLGYIIRHWLAYRKIESAEKKINELLKAAKIKQQELFFKAKEEALRIIEEAKKEEAERRKELKAIEEKLEKRQALFDKKLFELEEREKNIEKRTKQLEEVKEKIKKIYDEAKRKLEEISGYTREEAKKVLLEEIEKENQVIIFERLKKLEEQGNEEIEKRAKLMLINAMERLASSVASERTTSIVNLPSDEMKGRIIGREGRNIKVIEQLTGTEIIVDDTPEVIFISGFSPIRRQLAKRALEKLIADGRIQPARIERYVEEAKKELLEDIKSAGEDAVYQLGIVGLDPKLIQLLGRLKYRTSYGQNVLQHSIDVANLSAILASELGLDASLAKKAGLFHDIGKALDHEVEGAHPQIGKEIAEKYNLPEEVVSAIESHHDDRPKTLIGLIVKVADALSASRPGARYDTYEAFVKRLEDLEQIAKSFKGVEKSYAIQAGRELRVFVIPQEVDDLTAAKMAKEIAKRIEQELKYPGEIKVTVIRESRVVEFAR